MPVFARSAHDAQSSVSLNQHVLIGRGDVDHARLVCLAIFRVLCAQLAFARQQFRKQARRVGGNVKRHEHRRSEVARQRLGESHQSLDSSSGRADHYDALRHI